MVLCYPCHQMYMYCNSFNIQLQITCIINIILYCYLMLLVVLNRIRFGDDICHERWRFLGWKQPVPWTFQILAKYNYISLYISRIIHIELTTIIYYVYTCNSWSVCVFGWPVDCNEVYVVRDSYIGYHFSLTL